MSKIRSIVAADRVSHRAITEQREDRYTSAAEMERELQAVLSAPDATATVTAQQFPRLIGLPVRMLRPDADADILGDVLKATRHVTE